MAQLVNSLFERPLKEEIRIGGLAVELRAQPVNRNDRYALRIVGIAKDEAMRGFVEIEVRKRQRHRARLGMRALHFRDERRNEELPSRCVERAARYDERPFEARAHQETLLEADCETVQECSVNGVDRHDANPVHLAAEGSPGAVAKLAG